MSAQDASSTNLQQDERKKLRNRLSQRAFRRRQAECLRDLRNRVDNTQDSGRIDQLQHENTLLRAELVKLQGKLSLLMGKFQGLSDSITHTLDASPSSEEQSGDSPSSDQSQVSSNTDFDWGSLSTSCYDVAEPTLSLATDLTGIQSITLSDTVFADNSRSQLGQEPFCLDSCWATTLPNNTSTTSMGEIFSWIDPL